MTGVVAWFTGLPSSGKSTLATAVAADLRARGVAAVILDGDDVRGVLGEDGYDDAARARFYGTLARLAALIARQGHVVLVPATAHRRAFRDAARDLAPAFVEIFVDTPVDECRRRDTKGLYGARTALAPGAGLAYEPPTAPDFQLRPGDDGAAARIAVLLAALR